METALHEAQARSRDQIFQSSRDEDLAGICRGCDTGTDVRGDTAHVVAAQLALAGMEAAADLQTERTYRVADGQRTAHTAC